jgi:hypothetical protein
MLDPINQGFRKPHDEPEIRTISEQAIQYMQSTNQPYK